MSSFMPSSSRVSNHPHHTTQDDAVAGVDLLANLDYSSLEELDPSLVDGYRVIYDREVSLEVRMQEALDGQQHIGTVEGFKVKILVLGEDESPMGVRVELSSEADLFFHYAHDIDEAGFAVMQEQQRLMVDFVDYPAVLIKMFNHTIHDPSSHLGLFVLLPDSTAKVEFIQNLEYKFIELLSAVFLKSPDETIQQHITYRYNAVKGRLAILQARLSDVNSLLKHKNPTLLLQLQKAPSIALTTGTQGGAASGSPAKSAPAAGYNRRPGEAY